MNEQWKREILTIAHSYGVKCRFSKKTIIAEADVYEKIIILNRHSSKNVLLSEFFHELGHVLDYENGVYKEYYRRYPTKKALRRLAVKAELHTDLTGEKLMKKYYPGLHFISTYKYKKWQRYLKEYWGIL